MQRGRGGLHMCARHLSGAAERIPRPGKVAWWLFSETAGVVDVRCALRTGAGGTSATRPSEYLPPCLQECHLLDFDPTFSVGPALGARPTWRQAPCQRAARECRLPHLLADRAAHLVHAPCWCCRVWGQAPSLSTTTGSRTGCRPACTTTLRR